MNYLYIHLNILDEWKSICNLSGGENKLVKKQKLLKNLIFY